MEKKLKSLSTRAYTNMVFQVYIFLVNLCKFYSAHDFVVLSSNDATIYIKYTYVYVY